jgi:hypothetical protein
MESPFSEWCKISAVGNILGLVLNIDVKECTRVTLGKQQLSNITDIYPLFCH